MKTKTLFKIKLKILIVILFTLITITGCNKYSKEIEKTCPDCEQIEVRKLKDLIFVKKSNGDGNVFSKSQMKFLLDNWSPANYDEGIIYDDITFNVDGHYISFSEDQYSEISNENLKKRLEEKIESSSNSSSSVDTPPAGYHKGGNCSECHGTGYIQHDIAGTKIDDTGGICASCNGKGYHWVKDY